MVLLHRAWRGCRTAGRGGRTGCLDLGDGDRRHHHRQRPEHPGAGRVGRRPSAGDRVGIGALRAGRRAGCCRSPQPALGASGGGNPLGPGGGLHRGRPLRLGAHRRRGGSRGEPRRSSGRLEARVRRPSPGADPVAFTGADGHHPARCAGPAASPGRRGGPHRRDAPGSRTRPDPHRGRRARRRRHRRVAPGPGRGGRGRGRRTRRLPDDRRAAGRARRRRPGGHPQGH